MCEVSGFGVREHFLQLDRQQHSRCMCLAECVGYQTLCLQMFQALLCSLQLSLRWPSGLPFSAWRQAW